MLQLRPSWQLSLGSAAVLGLLAVLLPLLASRRRHRATAAPGGARPGVAARALTTAGALAREAGVVMALLGIWQLVGGLVHTRTEGAVERAEAIRAAELWLHLPGEDAVQRLLLPLPELVRLADRYYAYVHLNSMALFLLWCWWRRRDGYPAVRATVVLSTLACLVIQIVPVAPPRLLPEHGYVDTAAANGESVYGPLGTGVANQLSAMPSVHVAWALIVGGYLWRLGGRRWRLLGPLHAALTVVVVVVTANHWWLDALVAALVVGTAAAAAHGVIPRPRRVPGGTAGLPASGPPVSPDGTGRAGGIVGPPRGVPTVGPDRRRGVGFRDGADELGAGRTRRT